MADITKPINITATPPPASIPTNPLGNVGVGSGALEANLPTVIEVSGKADVTTIAVAIHGLGEENIPDPRLFKFLADKFGVSERALLNAYKQVSETVRGSDASSRVARKVLLEAQTAREELKLSTKTSRYDQVVKSDQFSAGLAKPFTEIVSKYDAILNKTTGKGLAETKTVVDVFSKQIGIILAEIDYWLQDYGFAGYTERALHLSDVLSRVVSYKRTFTDIVDATDDFYGAANIDDDQIATVNKALVDWGTTVEAIATWARKVLQDQARTADQISLAPNTRLVSSLGLPNTGITYSAIKGLEIQSTSSDRLALAVSTVVDEDQVLQYDKITRKTGKGLEISFTKSDTLTLAATPTKLDTASASDSAAKGSAKVLADQFSKSDVLALSPKPVKLDVATTSESSFRQAGKGLTDQFSKSDTLSLTPRPVKLDTTSAADAAIYKSGKYLAITSTLTDKPALSVGRPLADVLAGTSEVASRAYYKNIMVTGYFLKDYSGGDYAPPGDDKAIYTADYFVSVANYIRGFADLVDATDDFYGAANIDDDQVAAFGKGLIEYAQTCEYFLSVTSYIRSHTDTSSLSDTRYLKPIKVVSDNSSLSDTFTRQVQFLRTVTDSGATSELRIAAVSKASADTYRATDTAVLQAQFIRGFTDTGTTSETKAFWSQPRFLDTKAVLDSNTKISGKYLQDSTVTSKLIQLNVQNYSLERYAAVGYVGQTFVY